MILNSGCESNLKSFDSYKTILELMSRLGLIRFSLVKLS